MSLYYTNAPASVVVVVIAVVNHFQTSSPLKLLSQPKPNFMGRGNESLYKCRRYVPVGVPLDLSTPTGMSCIGTYGENCKSDSVSKYHVLLVAFQLL